MFNLGPLSIEKSTTKLIFFEKWFESAAIEHQYRLITLLKKRLQRRYFHVNIVIFLEHLF